MKRLSSYNYPLDIVLNILDNCIAETKFIDEISQLTRLKSVQIQSGHLLLDSNRSYWHKSSSLHNIECLKINTKWPIEIMKYFPNLKRIQIRELDQAPKIYKIKELITCINSNDLLEELPSTLNSLSIDVSVDTEDYNLNHLTNLTQLKISNANDYSGGFHIGDLTALRSLNYTSLNIFGLEHLTNLTELKVNNNIYEFNNMIDVVLNTRNLLKLERFTLLESVHCNSGSNPFAIFSRLTYLKITSEGNMCLLPKSIKHLNITSYDRFEVDSLAHLALESLTISAAKPNDYENLLNNLTRLTRLKIKRMHINSRLPLLKQTNLVDLTLSGGILTTEECRALKNLQKLTMNDVVLTGKDWDNLQHLKSLNYFSLSYSNEQKSASVNYSTIADLPIRTLKIKPNWSLSQVDVFPSLAKMTDLRHLDLLRITSAEEVAYLTNLKNLRLLRVVEWQDDELLMELSRLENLQFIAYL